jgi:hypothetical protein
MENLERRTHQFLRDWRALGQSLERVGQNQRGDPFLHTELAISRPASERCTKLSALPRDVRPYPPTVHPTLTWASARLRRIISDHSVARMPRDSGLPPTNPTCQRGVE